MYQSSKFLQAKKIVYVKVMEQVRLEAVQSQVYQLKQSKEFSHCRKSLASLSSLLADTRLWAELNLLKRMTPKIAIRLRNSPYSRSLEQLSRVSIQFKAAVAGPNYWIEEIKVYMESDFASEGTVSQIRNQIDNFLSQIQYLADKIFLIVIFSTKSFELSQLWLDLGQLVNHFLVTSCAASRICIYAKALLVYIYDINQMIMNLRNVFIYSEINDNYPISQQDQIIKSYFEKLSIKTHNNGSKTNENTKNYKKPDDISLRQESEKSFDVGDRDLFAKKTKTLNENLVVDQLHNKTKLKNQQKQTSKYKFEKVIALKNARKEVQSTMEKKKLETVRTLQHQKQRMNKEMANRLTFKKKTNKQKKSI